MESAQDVVMELRHKNLHTEEKAMEEKVLALAGFLGELRSTLVKSQGLRREDVTAEILQELEDLIQNGLLHREGMQETMKKARAKLRE